MPLRICALQKQYFPFYEKMLLAWTKDLTRPQPDQDVRMYTDGRGFSCTSAAPIARCRILNVGEETFIRSNE
jgi:hypothetical protein